MKRFDPESIKNRWMQDLQSKPEWKNIQKGGATEQYLEAQAEPIAEAARYGEYLLREMKWATANNFSSVKHQSRLIGKKLDRKHSAVGTIVVSHSAPSVGGVMGGARYLNLGGTLLDIDQPSNYDDGVDDKSTGANLFGLTPYLEDVSYKIPVGSTFECDTNGLKYIAAEQKVIKKFTSKWSTISRNADMKDAFYADGGWEGYKYLIVPIVQGELKTVILGQSDNSAAQSFLVDTLDIEAADSYYTKQFCYIEVADPNTGETTVWEEVYHLSTVDSISRKFEINILDDMTGTEIRFGDGINGAIPPKDSIITLHYLETKGKAGNVADLYTFSPNVSGAFIPEGLKVTIGCQNMWAIFGGKDLEKLSDYKASAEVAYEKNYEIMHQYTEFIRRLNEVAPVPIIKPKIKSSWMQQEISTGGTSVKVLTPVIGVTGLNGNLSKFTTTEQALFNKIATNKLSDNILSSKYVVYEEPNIVKINSHVTLELKESVVSPNDVKNEIENGLQQRIGKYNLDAIDCYHQVRLIQETLNLYDNIASIDTVDLITIGVSEISSVSLTGTDYILFKFKLPSVDINVLSANEKCIKLDEDGNKISALINIKIGDIDTSYVMSKGSGSTLSVSTDSDLTPSSEGDFKLLECTHIYKTLSRSELSNESNVDTTNITNSNVIKYFESDKSTLRFNLGIDLASIKKALNLPDTYTRDDVVSNLRNKFAKNSASIDFCFECPDKTLNLVDWNSVWYYDNIEVDVKS